MELSLLLKVVYYILITVATLLGLYVGLHFLIWALMIIFGLPISTKKQYDKPSKFYSALFNLGYWSLVTCAGARIHVTGLELLPDKGKFMFISNHRSNFDNMIHAVALRKYPLAFISKKENFKIPIGKHFMTRCCYLSLDRGNRKQGIGIIDRAADLIQTDATSVGVFPEGTRSKDLTLLPFKAGTFKIAKKAECPIVVGITRGTENIHKNFPFKRTDVYFDIIKVLTPEEIAQKNTVEIADELHEVVYQKLMESAF